MIGAVSLFAPTRGGAAKLEVKFQAKLHDARVVGGSNLAKRRGSQARAYGVPVGVIEEVDSFGAELQVHSFAVDPRVLEQSEVPTLEPWPGHNAAARIADARLAIGHLLEHGGHEE